jgi:alpha-N-arabinofuranosidase
MRKIKPALLALFLAPVFASAQYKASINEIKYPIQPTMWGFFFEDINRSGDGGIYAELVKNRSFDFPDAFMGWATEPARRMYARNDVFQIINQSATNDNNPKYMQITVNAAEKIMLANEGFGGITVKKGMNYDFKMLVRQQTTGLQLKVSIVNAAGKPVGETNLSPGTSQSGWQTITASITTTDTTVKGKLLISFTGTGKLDIDRISLFPTDTWMNRAGGMRNDLVKMLADIKPGFMRFPGGCIVEGEDLATRYQWKKTIGPLDQRKLNSNQWSDGGASGRPLKDYFQSYGLGFMEYFQLCEDMKAEPMPILNTGLSCQFGAGEVVPADQLYVYVQDALDLVEFANGDASSKWGKKRIELGHPQPFNLKLLGIGNENWGPQYVERLLLFTKAIKAKYPYIQLITSTGYSPNPQFKYMDSVLRKLNVDIIDEHYYQTAPWFLMNAGKYDNYDRKGPKIFLGEYACHSIRIGNPENKNTQLCALAEAAFMTGLERNADIVTMAAYAPLFAHVKDWQWTPNLIWFDNAKSYGTPSYYVQQLFSLNKGTDVVPLTENGNTIAGADSIWASAVIDRATNEVIIKLVNPSGAAKQKTIEIPAMKKKSSTAAFTVLKSERPDAVNSIETAAAIIPVTNTIDIKNKKVVLDLSAYSFNVIRIRL